MTMKLLKGGRPRLEHELLRAMFTPGAKHRAEELKTRLVRRANGKLSAVSTESCRPADNNVDASPPNDGG